MRFWFFLSLIMLTVNGLYGQANRKFTISGYVREKGSGELLPGINVFCPQAGLGGSTNNYGFYSLTLKEQDSLQLIFTGVGFETMYRTVAFKADVELNIEMVPQQVMLQEIVVKGEKYKKKSEEVGIGKIDIPIEQIKDVPALMGEKDVFKVLQLMPGVQSGSEGNSGLYVRGGGPGENLIILDDAVVYNAYHLFGFFSLFNGDALKSVELIKGGFPARYGGRLSSVVEMNMKEGNKDKIHGEVGTGLIASRFMLEGPIIKNKASFLLSGRRTYLDVLTKPFMPRDEKIGYYFYDLNAKVNYELSEKDKIYLSGYFGQDNFNARFKGMSRDDRMGLQWANTTATFRWNHQFNKKLFANTSLIYSNYRFEVFEKSKDRLSNEDFSLRYYSGIRDFTFKYDLDYLPDPRHMIKMGLMATHHTFFPEALVVKGDPQYDMNIENRVEAVESGIYIEDVFRPVKRLNINAGFRLAHFRVASKDHIFPEPRLSFGYMLKDDLSIKGGYTFMNQFIHLLSNNGIGLPTDFWVPTTELVRPQRSQQVAAGIVKDITRLKTSVSLEGYYKHTDDLLGYKEGANFLFNEDMLNVPNAWQYQVTNGRGWAYGMELLIQKKSGRFNGWAGYTLSWAYVQFDSVNLGRKFHPRHDRRHDISLVGIYKLSDRVKLSATWVYGTGNAITIPLGHYYAPDHRPGVQTPNFLQNEYYGHNSRFRELYSERNAVRMRAYHRLDIGIQFEKHLAWGGVRTWEISIYNVYSRQNPFFYFYKSVYTSEGTSNYLAQVSLFPIIPSFTYNLKF